MTSFYTVVSKYANEYKYVWIPILVILLLTIVAYFIYEQIRTPLSKTPFKNVANSQQREVPITICFFYVDWCPHCKTAKPEWDAFRSEFHGKTVNDQLVECIEYNCTDDNDEKIKNLMNDFNVNSFPHIVMIVNENPVEFDAKITKSSLEQFVTTVTK